VDAAGRALIGDSEIDLRTYAAVILPAQDHRRSDRVADSDDRVAEQASVEESSSSDETAAEKDEAK
jgi:hypothetical protein